jgi:hypothetical protein
VINPEAAINIVQDAVVDGKGNALYGGSTIQDRVRKKIILNTTEKFGFGRHTNKSKFIL